MDFTGKKAVFLGDSITQGSGVSSADNIYHALLKDRLHLEKAVNYGISGTRIAKQTAISDPQSFDKHFVSRVDALDDDADLVVVFGGTNDYGHGDAPFGTLEDTTEDTFCGAYDLLCRKLINKFPNAEIVLMTPLHRVGEDNVLGDGSKKVPSRTLQEYVDAIRIIAERYSLPVLDLYAVSGIQPELEIIRETYCPDGLHPNERGHIRIANRLENFLKML